MSDRKVMLYISMSLDGYIASKDDDLSWLSVVESKNEDYGYAEFNEKVDTYIVGKKTYDVILKLTGGVFPQAEIHDCYVITRQKIENTNGVTFYNGELKELIETIRKKPGKHIYCDGGAQIVKLLMEQNLIDEYIISIIPIVLGDGKRLFIGQTPRLTLRAKATKQYSSGLVQLFYERV
ncbi:MAG: dihydrofolate reductase family protein [Vicingaceae bacterium]